ncbi:DUF5082 family protein [Lentibacillus sp. CBA3610]|uniref:YwqH-like family protein n=1 Tax=Lentibacillus sp. CBA3610 TaxID=2518176 RepID=UPI0015950F38|nr:DUF5082 family protein [Lentibacillus sp. CBA3610]QKY69801.1 DUF5082 domain-containing protein [Lentibacillus sp. CBA3610]
MTSLRQLRDQKVTVLGGMAHTENKISSLEDKISRLRQASSQLATNISELETIKGSITGLTIDAGRWKGEEESEFEEHYSSYEESVKSYVSKTEDAKDAMDQDIKRYEADKATYTTGLNNLENTLDSLERQISQAAERE